MLGVVVGGAVLGGRHDPAHDPTPEPTAKVALLSVVPAEPRGRIGRDLDRPRPVIVRGWVARNVGDVQVAIAGESRVPIAIASLDPTGKPRNGMVPFETSFALPRTTVASAGQLYVVPTDGRGRPLADGQWLAVQGAIVEIVIR